MFLPEFWTYFTMVLYVNGGRSSSSLSIFFSEGQSLNFSSFSLTRSQSLFCFEHEVQRRSLDYFDHFARDHLYTFEVLPSLGTKKSTRDANFKLAIT